MRDPREVVLDEFASYYHADELAFVVPDGVDDWADDTARRLVHLLGGRASEAVAVLQRVSRRQDDELLEELDRRTWYGWSGTAENWALFCAIVARIELSVHEQLTASRAAAPAGPPDSGTR